MHPGKTIQEAGEMGRILQDDTYSIQLWLDLTLQTSFLLLNRGCFQGYCL